MIKEPMLRTLLGKPSEKDWRPYPRANSRTTIPTVTYEWEGRSLTEYDDQTNTYTYTYNQDGIRNSKTINGTTTTYFLEGSKVIYETDGTSEIYYTRDIDGTLISILLMSRRWLLR